MEVPDNAMTTAVRKLLDELLQAHYGIDEQRYDEAHFGNALIILTRDRTFVRLVRDRGQWFVEIAGGTADDWFAPVVWCAFLDSANPSLETISFDGQVGLLRHDLARIEVANENFDDKMLASLQAWRQRRADARRALPPSS